MMFILSHPQETDNLTREDKAFIEEFQQHYEE